MTCRILTRLFTDIHVDPTHLPRALLYKSLDIFRTQMSELTALIYTCRHTYALGPCRVEGRCKINCFILK